MRSIICTAAILVLAGVPAVASPAANELLAYVPAQAQTVMAVDGAALRAHPTVQEYLNRQAGKWVGTPGDEARQFLSEAGLDLSRDVDTVIMALVAAGHHPQGVMLIGGSFSPDRIAAAVTARGAVATFIGGHPVYRLPQADKLDDEGPVFAVLSTELAVLGDVRSVTDLLAPRARASGIVEAEVAAGRLDTRAHFWLVTAIPAAAWGASSPWTDSGGSMAGVERAAGAVSRFGLSGSLTGKMRLRGWALTDSAENADLLRDAARGAVAALRLQAAGSNPELVNMLRDMDIRTRDTVLHMTIDVPFELWENLFSER